VGALIGAGVGLGVSAGGDGKYGGGGEGGDGEGGGGEGGGDGGGAATANKGRLSCVQIEPREVAERTSGCCVGMPIASNRVCHA